MQPAPPPQQPDATAAPVGVPIQKRLVLINSASVVGARLLTFVVFGWAIRELIQRVPEQELALLPVVLSAGFLAPVLESVLSSGLGRYVTEAYARHDLPRVTAIVTSVQPLLFAGAVVILAVGGVIAWQVGPLLDVAPADASSARFMLLLIFGRIALGLSLSAFVTGIVARQAYAYRSGLLVGGAVLQAVLLFALLGGVGARVEFVVLAQVTSQLFVLMGDCLLSRRLMPELRWSRPTYDAGVGREVVAFGGWYSMQQIAACVRRAADAPILHRLATPTDVNTFFMAGYIEDNLRNFINLASQPLLPALTAMHASGQTKRLADAYLRGGRLVTWVAMFAATPLILFADDLFAVYLGDKSRDHPDAPLVLRLLLVAFVATYPSRMIFVISVAIGRVRRVAATALVTATANLLLTLLLVGWVGLGAVGSAASTCLAFLVLQPLLVWPIAPDLLGVRWRRFFAETLAPGLAPAAVGGLAGAAVLVSGLAPGTQRALVGVALTALAYSATVVFAARPADRADMRRLAGRPARVTPHR